MDCLVIMLGLAFIAIVIGLAIVGAVHVLTNVLRRQPAAAVHKRHVNPELDDLEVTKRTIRQLHERGDLDAETAERVVRCLEDRRRTLQPKPVVRPIPTSPLAQLEELLGEGVHPRDLSPERRREALACYRRLSNSQRAALKAPRLLAMARLMEMVGMTSHALNAYHRLLDEHPELPQRSLIALEAARLAVREKLNDLARSFLGVALADVLPEAEYEEAQSLLRRLDESVQAPAAVAVAAAPTGETPVPPTPVRSAELGVRREETQSTSSLLNPHSALLTGETPRPRRSLTNVLAAFMEERNILWGELAGGLLIVGCSIALVITLWHSLEELPYFPFLIFASITAALFGAGEYTLHHWKLESTSRGLLVIAMLLVPLNLLVLADPSLGRAAPSLEWIFKAAALALSLGMVRLAGRDLIGVGVLPGPIDRRWLLMLAVVGSAGSQLLVEPLREEAHPLLLIVLGCVPVACHLLACSAVVAGLARAARANGRRQPAGEDLTSRLTPAVRLEQAHALFVFLGLSSFALFVALGFLLSRSGEIALILPRLAEPFALASVPILAGGLLIWRGLPHEESGTRTAGAAVAFTGLAFMLAAVVLAWPQPLPLLLVCLSNAALLTVLAFRWRIPYAHAVALPCLALAVLLVVQIASGHLAFEPEETLGSLLVEQLTSPSSGIVLAILMVLAAAGAEGLIRFGQRVHAASYAVGSGALGICALLTTACHGIESPWPAAIAHALSAACALTLHVRWRKAALPHIGLGLFVATSLWVLWAMAPDNLALWGFVLALESSVLASAAVAAQPWRGACRDIAAASAVLALGLALFTPGFPAQGLDTGTAALLALTAFVLAPLLPQLELAWLGSAFLFAALSHLLIWDLGAAAPPRPLLMALLTHATLTLFGALVLRASSASDGPILRIPLLHSAVLSSLFAVPLLLMPGITPLVLAGYTLWLAAVWLVVAILRRSPAWFSAFQMAVSVSVVYAVTAWLPEREWFDPYSLQTYGIGLSLLALIWIAARVALSGNARVRELWEASWPALDRVLLGLLVAGQFALAIWSILPGVDAELIPVGYHSLFDWPSTASHAYGPGAWGLLGILTIVLLAALREKYRTSILVGLLVLAVTVPILAAGPFGTELATASALRWGLALCYLACSALVWLRRHLARLAASAGVTVATDESAVLWSQGILAVVAVSVFLITMQVAILGFSDLPPSGPAPASIFAEMGWTLSHVIPLLVLTIGLVGHALRERSPLYAFLGGLLANISVSGGYALAVVTSGHHLETADTICVGQLVSLSAALWALAWQASQRWVYAWREEAVGDGFAPSTLASPLMRVQLGLALSVQLLLLVLGIASLSDLTSQLPPWPAAVGSPLGWLALLAALSALYLRFVQRQRPLPWGWLYGSGLAAVSLLACTADRISPSTGFYFLLLGWPLYVLLWSHLPLTLGWVERSETHHTAADWGLLPDFVAVLWALNVAASRQEHLWAAAAVSLCALASAVCALWSSHPRFVWISGLLVDLIAVLLGSAWGSETTLTFLLTNALGLAVAASFWSVIGLRSGGPISNRPYQLQPHSSFVAFAANTALGLVVLVVLLLLGSNLQPPRMTVSALFAWCTVAAVGIALVSALWDRNDRFAPPGLYVLGLAAVGLILHELTRSPSGLGWCAALALASYAVLASFLSSIFSRSRDPWFLLAQAVTAGLVVILSLWMCLDFATRIDRLAGPGAVLLLIPAALLSSFPNSVWERRPRNSVSRLLAGMDSRETEFREVGSQTEFGNQKSSTEFGTQKIIYVVLILGALAAAEIAWACPDPGGSTPWLHRNVLLMVALAGMTVLYGVALPRWLAAEGEWVRCARRSGLTLGILASLVLLVLLVQEFRLYDVATGRTPMLAAEIVVVIAALVALMVSGIRFAVIPDSDPFGLSESGRTLFVYAVEVLLILLFLHLRLTVPELFRGWLNRYWMFIVMLIAFAGVGLSEFFERRRLRVLSEPFQRTGVFLPLLPLLAFWARPLAPELPPLMQPLVGNNFNLNTYAFLWLLVCGLYSLVSLTRHSSLFALLAALAANFALWSLLAQHGIAFLLHPQCWLIPPALIVLAAEHVNRERLRPEVSAGLRYLGISMIYVSSTADLFITGLGNSVVLPIVLAVLSLAGVLLGILFHVRAFLFLGISFLFLDVFTMIWYAAVDRYQTWVWWVSGIVLGVAILTLFAVFEKRRNDVLRMLEEIKRWD